ncbi:MAG: TIGR04086 family membrane protein [Clostridia bacterium]|nr:TIGR04086 family membrane protein [Clostridia bacterium]
MFKAKTTKQKAIGYLKLQCLNLAVYASLFLLMSIISLKADAGKEHMLYYSLSFLVVGSFISGFICGIKERKNGILCGIVSALPVNLIIITVSLLLNGFKVDISLLYTLIAGVISAVAGGIISVNIRLK